MLDNSITKDVLSLAGLISTPCFLLMTWMYSNGIKNLRKDIHKVFSKLDKHIQWHLDQDK
jgi:hypothetical protein